MSPRTWQASLATWLERHTDAAAFVIYYGKTLVVRIEHRGGGGEREAVVAALEDAGSLAGTARTFVVIAVSGDADRELGRIDVKIDPKSIALAHHADRELSTREATATASVIAATDHRTVQATIKSVAEQNAESHNALVALVKVFGESAGQVLKGNAEVVKTLDARAERDAKEIDRLAEENAKLRTQNQALQEIADTAMAQAEKFKGEASDLVLLCRASFGDQFRDTLQNFLANKKASGDAAELLGAVLSSTKGNGAS